MKNITISVDDETYRRARLWAADRETSISAIVRCILTSLPARSQNRPAAPQPLSGKIHASTVSEADNSPVLVPAWGLTVLRASHRLLKREGLSLTEKHAEDK